MPTLPRKTRFVEPHCTFQTATHRQSVQELRSSAGDLGRSLRHSGALDGDSAEAARDAQQKAEGKLTEDEERETGKVSKATYKVKHAAASAQKSDGCRSAALPAADDRRRVADGRVDCNDPDAARV